MKPAVTVVAMAQGEYLMVDGRLVTAYRGIGSLESEPVLDFPRRELACILISMVQESTSWWTGCG